MRDAGCSKDARYRSPLTFLLTTEALTRAINGDTDIEGLISTDNGRYNLKINPFADDTALITRDYASLKQALQWMKAHENATGGKTNEAKFQGIRMGSQRAQKPPWDIADGLEVATPPIGDGEEEGFTARSTAGCPSLPPALGPL